MKKYIAIALLMVLGTAYPAYARWSVGTAGGGAAVTASYEVSYRSMSESNTPGTSIDCPADCAASDILIAGCLSDTAENQTWGDNWTQITTVDSSSSRLQVAYLTAAKSASYQFTSSTTDDSCFIACFTKTGGTWNISDYDESAAAAAQTIDTTEVTGVTNGILIVVYGNDDNAVISSHPADMTNIMDLWPGSRGIASYYQATTATGYTKTIAVLGYVSDNSTISVVINAQ